MLFSRKKPAHHKVEYIIFGLGNPGTKYSGTRHNVGWWVLDELARRHKPQKTQSMHKSQVDFVKLTGAHGDITVALVKPTTYMNHSGQSVREWVRAHPEAPWVVVYDDVDLPPSKLRLRPDGSAGGHNGMKSIIQSLGGHSNFARLRLGIGRPPGRMDPSAYVLQNFSRDEVKTLSEILDRAADAALEFIMNGLDKAMNKFNGSIEPS